MGAGVDPHLYQPTESDIRAMNRADMVIYSGLHLEGQFDAVFAALREQGTLVYALSQPVKDAGYVVGGFVTEQYQAGTDDPHFWFDPRNWELTVTDLAQTLAELDPAGADVYSRQRGTLPRRSCRRSLPGPTKACARLRKASATSSLRTTPSSISVRRSAGR